MHCHKKVILAEEVEVVKAVSADELEKRDDDTDQVALETNDQDGAPSIHGFPHQHQQQHPPPNRRKDDIFLMTQNFN